MSKSKENQEKVEATILKTTLAVVVSGSMLAVIILLWFNVYRIKEHKEIVPVIGRLQNPEDYGFEEGIIVKNSAGEIKVVEFKLEDNTLPDKVLIYYGKMMVLKATLVDLNE
jgi:hypothetical protein